MLGQVTAVQWLAIRNETRLTICFGTTLGHLSFWRQRSNGEYEELFSEQIGDRKEILSIEADKPTLDYVLFAVGTLCGQVQLWKLDNHAVLWAIFSVSVGDMVPRKVTISQSTTVTKSKVKTVTAFGFYDGQMYVVVTVTRY